MLFLEDDVLVDTEAPDRIAGLEFPDDVAVISVCDMREVPEFSPDGLYLRDPMGSDGRGWWGNQALLIHPETAVMLGRVNWFAPEIEGTLGIRVHKVTPNDAKTPPTDQPT